MNIKNNVLTLTLLLFSISAYAIGTPGMGIRCGFNNAANGELIGCGPDFYYVMGNCYPLEQYDGYCDTISTAAFGWVDFEYYDFGVAGTEGMVVTICVPDCTTSCDTECAFDEFPAWSLYDVTCECEGGTFEPGESHAPCDCPAPLVLNPDWGAGEANGENFVIGRCILPQPAGGCFQGELEVTIPPIDCNTITPTTSVELIIRPLGGGNFPPDVAVTLESLANCDLLNSQDQGLIDVMDLFNGGNSSTAYGFFPEPDGSIIVELNILDPQVDAILQFGGGASPIIIPACISVEIVPTLGEWAIICLSLLMIIFGVVGISQYKRRKSVLI